MRRLISVLPDDLGRILGYGPGVIRKFLLVEAVPVSPVLIRALVAFERAAGLSGLYSPAETGKEFFLCPSVSLAESSIAFRTS